MLFVVCSCSLFDVCGLLIACGDLVVDVCFGVLFVMFVACLLFVV